MLIFASDMDKLTTIATLLAGICLSGCAGRHADATGFDLTVYEPEYAEGYRIDGRSGSESVIITSTNPWQGADNVSSQLFVARNGEEPPSGFDGQVLRGDAQRIVVMSSTHIAFLDAIDATGRIKGVSVLDGISNEKVLARRAEIADVGYDGNINYELLMGLRPDLVLLYGVNGSSPMETKLRELGIAYMYVGDYLENDPLGKAEWLIAVGEACGQRREAIEKFNSIPERYNALKQLVAAAAADTPAVIINAPYNGVWFVPPTDSYAVRLITDAGGRPAYRQPTDGTDMSNARAASFPLDLESAYEAASQADVWLNPGIASSMADVAAMCPKFTDTPPVMRGQVFNNNLRSNTSGGNDYFESGAVHPDLILRDLIEIFHPGLTGGELTYYRQLK